MLGHRATMKGEEHTHGRSSSLVPLLTRLERLDSLLKYIERRRSTSVASNGNGSNGEERRVALPLDLAVQEARVKGSVLDRVSLLERRLAQMSIEMEEHCIPSTSAIMHSFGSPEIWLESSRKQYSSAFECLDEQVAQQQDSQVRGGRSTSSAQNLKKERNGAAGGGSTADHKDTEMKQKRSLSKKHKPWKFKRLLGC